ncbi:MAG: hypothetical protein ABL995_05100 [Bryobacteraceae bacterium]
MLAWIPPGRPRFVESRARIRNLDGRTRVLIAALGFFIALALTVPVVCADDVTANLRTWRRIKEQLTGAQAAQNWRKLNQASVPGGENGVWKFSGKLISAKPEKNPEQLLVAIDGDKAEARVLLVDRLKGSMKPGARIAFSGVAIDYAKQPFQPVIESDPNEIEGWVGR